MSKHYEITIKMSIEDIQDLNLHMSMAKSQIKEAIDKDYFNPDYNTRYQGMDSYHEVTITKSEDEG